MLSRRAGPPLLEAFARPMAGSFLVTLVAFGAAAAGSPSDAEVSSAAYPLRRENRAEFAEPRTLAGQASSQCAGCDEAEASLACRSCLNGLDEQSFCLACSEQGLNDVGCRNCKAANSSRAAEELASSQEVAIDTRARGRFSLLASWILVAALAMGATALLLMTHLRKRRRMAALWELHGPSSLGNECDAYRILA
mmetsp:Transcript_8318/g.18168  ORF Transcript_8318/g.18168 Transcript_8318/m.18168 type:complete len:195 (-) Transcript_8318:1-585(-)